MWPSEKGGSSPVWSRRSFSTWAGQYGHKLVEMVFMNGLLWNRAGWLEAYSCDMKCWDGLWRAPRSSRWWEPPDLNSCLHAAVLASLPSGNGFPLLKSLQLRRISCGGHLVRIISALKGKSKCQFRMTLQRAAEAQLHLQAITKSPRLIKFFFLSQLFLPVL